MSNGSAGSIGLKVAIGLNAVLLLALGYGFVTTRTAIDNRFSSVETAAQHARDTQTETDKKITNLSSDFDQINKRVGITNDQLQQARQTAQLMKRQQDEAAKQLSQQLAAKANSTDVETVRQEATTKLAEFQQNSDAKLVTVSGEVDGVKKDLVATREEFGRQIVDVKTVLSDGIAKNSTELADLRRKGERDYFEFDLRRNTKQPLQRIADLQLALLKTDPKNHKYSVAIQVDDNRLEKRDRTTNEPVQFLVGKDSLRYEIVVNSVDKDRIRGYVSAPKDKVLSAEAPTLRKQ
jgi:hypothetical protein